VALQIILIDVNNGNESIFKKIEKIEGVAMASTLNCLQGYLQPKKTKRPPK
jgi:hypothetical protein